MTRSPTSEKPRQPSAPVAIDLPGDFLSAKDAAQLLRIKPQTLYAYVSRGWIHSMGHDKRRGYLYLREDVERLRARGHARAEGGPYKGGTPRWSEPIVQTTITTITPAGPVYRGHPALELAERGHSFESVAELLWSGVWMEDQGAWPDASEPVVMDRFAKMASVDIAQPDFVKLSSLLVMSLAARSAGSDDIRDGNTIIAARTLLTVLPGCMGYLSPARKYAGRGRTASPTGSPLAARVLASLGGGPYSTEAMKVTNAALVLLADHELTPQTFAARLAASSGASLFFCVLSALSAHSGSRIRRAVDKVEDLLTTAKTAAELRERFAEMERSVNVMPGLNHPLYPNGDPRADYLLRLARDLSGGRSGPNLSGMIDAAASDLGARPSVEAGLVALCHALRLPLGSAGAILTISRCAGWIAHAVEQRLAGMMLRPRARYLSIK